MKSLMLKLMSLAMVIYSGVLIQISIPNLPRRIPIHFNAAGIPDGWGRPDTLWVLLGAQALTWAIFLVVPYVGKLSPGAVHLGARRLNEFPPAQRARMLSVLHDMACYLSIVINLFFVIVLRRLIQAAAQPIPHLHVFGPLALLMVGTSQSHCITSSSFAAPREAGDGNNHSVMATAGRPQSLKGLPLPKPQGGRAE